MPIVNKLLDALQNRQKQLEDEVKALKAAIPQTHQDQGSTKTANIPTDVEARVKEILLQAKDEALQIKQQAEEEAAKIRQESLQIETRLSQKETSLDQQLEELKKKEEEIAKVKKGYEEGQEQLEKTRLELLSKIEKTANLTREEAKKILFENLEKQLAGEIGKKIKETEEQFKSEAQDKAREIIVDAMLHGATDWVAEYTVSTIRLPNEEVKGRIIGKEGRNIRAFEMATGVDVELDSEVPNEIRLSSFDPVRREIARVALERLIIDGRIQPARIEEFVARAKTDVAKDMSEAGRKASHEVGVFNLDQEVLDMLGRLKFRTSYGQNQLLAAVETAKIAKKLAIELSADQSVTTVGGMLHDIGKAQSPEKEGNHVQLGVEFLKKKNIPQKVIDCVAQHHEDEPFTSVESMIVHIADAISGARPGARHESVEEYVKRLSNLEEIAKKHKGVDEAYAIAAGREVRVAVLPEQISDEEVPQLAHDIALEIEEKLSYPGQVKVTVIRQNRAEAIAA